MAKGAARGGVDRRAFLKGAAVVGGTLARERGLDTVYVPALGAREATLLGGVRVMPVPTLTVLVGRLHGATPRP